jgi:primase-polymerase (primpol)-like protein
MNDSRPTTQAPQFQNIPDALKVMPHWVLWRYEFRTGRWTKVPLRADDPSRRASSTDESTWSRFEQAKTAFLQLQNADGIGFVVSENVPVVGIDLDHIYDTSGEAKPLFTDIVTQLDTYAEISPSGEGIRLFATGQLPPGRRKVGDIECYVTARFLTVTGRVFGTPRPVAERTLELAGFHTQYMSPPAKPARPTPGITARSPRTPVAGGSGREGEPIDDHTLLMRMFVSTAGPRIRQLWRGDRSGYGSASEADLGLISHLLWWCKGDTYQVDRLFRQSGLYREKWDREDYRERTLQAAIGEHHV